MFITHASRVWWGDLSKNLLRFLEPEWIFLRPLSANAGFTPAETAARTHEVWTYLGLSADQFPHALWPTQPEATS